MIGQFASAMPDGGSPKGMNLIAVLILVVAMGASWRLRAIYGWGYNAMALLVVFSLASAVLRAMSRPLDLKAPEIPEPENEEAKELIREIDRNRRDIARLQRRQQFDAIVGPLALLLPLLICLLVFRDAFYRAESRVWILVGVAVSLVLLLLRGWIYDSISQRMKRSEP